MENVMSLYLAELTLLARSQADEWLDKNPLVLSAIFSVIGIILLITGIRNVLTGQATGKWGTQHSGGMAHFLGIVRVVGSVICFGVAVFGLVKAFF
jgi:hypothetical protein